MRKILYLNNEWKFKAEFDEAMINPDYQDKSLADVAGEIIEMLL